MHSLPTEKIHYHTIVHIWMHSLRNENNLMDMFKDDGLLVTQGMLQYWNNYVTFIMKLLLRCDSYCQLMQYSLNRWFTFPKLQGCSAQTPRVFQICLTIATVLIFHFLFLRNHQFDFASFCIEYGHLDILHYLRFFLYFKLQLHFKQICIKWYPTN